MLAKTRAIVLHYIKYAETSIIATLYTEKFGRQTVIVHSVFGKKPKFPPSFFLPLTLLDVDIYYKSGRDIQRIKDISCIYHFHSIPFQVSKSTIALFISEILFKTLKEELANQTRFDFLINAIQLLDLKEAGIQNFHVSFLIQLLKYIGIYPYNTIKYNILTDETFSVIPPHADDSIMNGYNQLCQYPLSQLENVNINHETRISLLDYLIKYYQLHFDYSSGIKSLEILKNIFK